jgi:hypothetical protein
MSAQDVYWICYIGAFVLFISLAVLAGMHVHRGPKSGGLWDYQNERKKLDNES